MERIVVEEATVSTGQFAQGGTWSRTAIVTNDGKQMSGFESNCPGISKVTKGAMLDVETEVSTKGGKDYINITSFTIVQEGEKAKTQADFDKEKFEKQIVMDGGAVMKAVGMCYDSVPQKIRDHFDFIADSVLESWRNLREGGGMVYENGEGTSHIVPLETARQNLRDAIKDAGMNVKDAASHLGSLLGQQVPPTKTGITTLIDSLDREKLRKANKSVVMLKLNKDAEDGNKESDEDLF